MDNTQTLEMQIKANAESAISSVNKLISGLTNLENGVQKITTKLDSNGKVINQTISSARKEGDKLYTTLQKIDKNGNLSSTTTTMSKLKNITNSTTDSLSKLNNVFSITGAYLGAKKLTSVFLDWMDLAIDRTEQLNLFNVVFKNIETNGERTFSELGKSATKFQYDLQEKFGTNITETFKYQGLFQSMGENVGIEDTYSSIMSETMTKLTYDLASLYNKSESTVAEALRAGVYAGQTKPLRSYGIDVTQTSMQPILDSLGISDRTIKQMSQAEKEILRYLATLKQAKVAMGDMANTIESPSNQIKIFKQQLVEAKVALSNLFIGTFAKILPYANALLMVVTQVAKAIADMFGIEITDYNSGIASSEDAYYDLSDSIDNATDSVKELKRQTLGFDQINNINENKNNGSTVTGGIDQRLLDAIYGYDNGMDKVRMKATEIRDRIMEWLGFTKEIDSLTGETTWSYGGISKTIKNILNSISKLSTKGKLVVSTIMTLLGLKLITKITSFTKKISGSGGLIRAITSLVGWIKTGVQVNGNLIKGLKEGVSAWVAQYSGALKFAGALGSIISTVTGVISILGSFNDAVNGISTSWQKVALEITAVVGGTTALGAIIGGPFGAALGALAGGLITVVTAVTGYKNSIRELAESQLFGELTISTESWVNILKTNGPTLTNSASLLSELQTKMDSLKGSFDSNLETVNLMNYTYGLLGKTMDEDVKNTIINSVEEMCSSTSSIIQSTTDYQLQLWGDYFTTTGTLNDEENQSFLQNIINYGDKQKIELKNAQDNITGTYKTAIETRGYLTDDEYNYIAEQLQKIKDLTNQSMSVAESDMVYWLDRINSDTEILSKESYNNLLSAQEEYLKGMSENAQIEYNNQLNSLNYLLDTEQITQDEYNKRLAEINETRTKTIEEANQKTEEIISSALESLKQKYIELETDTSSSAKEQRKIIESILKDANIDTTQLKAKVCKVAKDISDTFGANFRNNYSIDIRLNKSLLQNDLNSINRNLGTNYSVYTKANGGIFAKGKWDSIPQYANGGIPSHGTMFIAGEAGAEVVGHINGRTEVLNQSQIASAIYSAVLSAMTQSGGQTTQVDVHVHTDEGTVVDRINQTTKQTGICPINIPV